MERLVSLISGGGTTMEQIVRAVRRKEIRGLEIGGVIASTRNAGGLAKARNLLIPDECVRVVSRSPYRRADESFDEEGYAQELHDALAEMGATVVTQNGWLPQTPASVIAQYPGRIFNQHPGHPVEFGGEGMYGRRVHAALLEFQRRVKRVFPAYVVAQHVDERIDAGSVVQCAAVPVREDDTVESLQQRALPFEHDVQITLLQALTEGRLREIELPTFVHAQELSHLMEAKRVAIEAYPKG